MKPILAVFAFLFLGLWSEPSLAKPIKIGHPAPDLDLPDTYGKRHTLRSFQGKFVVLEWLNHECPFVVKHYKSGAMQKLQKEYTQKGVIWLSIVSSAPGKQGYTEPAQANALTKSKGAAPTAVLRDPEGVVGKSYRARTTPHIFVIDPKGILVYAGAIDSIRSTSTDDIPKATPYVRLALDQAMKGKKVEIPQTPPYGCSVKYKN